MLLNEIAKKLNKDYNDTNLMIKADIVPKYTRLPLGDMGFDFASYGGLPEGRISTISGVEHSGKTLLSVLALASYQKAHPDKTCVFVDVEHTLDMQFTAMMTGVDWGKVYYFDPKTLSAEDICQAILDIQQTDDVGMIILDSVAAMKSAIDLDTDISKNNGMRGAIAGTLHRFLPVMTGLVSEKKNIFLPVNQVRKSTTLTGAIIYREPGGDALAYYRSVGIRCGRRTYIKGDKTDVSDGTGADGIRINFVFTKNKTADTRRGGGFVSFNYLNGLDATRDLIEVAVGFGYIQRSGAIYQLVNLDTGEIYLKDEQPLKFKGKQELYDFLSNKRNSDFVKEYYNMLERHISASNDVKNILNEDTTNQILEEEANIVYD